MDSDVVWVVSSIVVVLIVDGFVLVDLVVGSEVFNISGVFVPIEVVSMGVVVVVVSVVAVLVVFDKLLQQPSVE